MKALFLIISFLSSLFASKDLAYIRENREYFDSQYEELNAIREKFNRKELIRDSVLELYAYRWAKQMAKVGKVYHGGNSFKTGANECVTNSPAPFKAFLSSTKGHRQAVLWGSAKKAGIGMCSSKSGRIYLCLLVSQ